MLQKITELKSGVKLRYTVSLPASYSPVDRYPLVMALHYGGRVTPFYGKGFLAALVQPALEGLEAVIVAPDCPGRGWTALVSEHSVLELLEHISEEFSVDRRRTLLLGYSMGGIGTWFISSRHSHLFSAAIAISALPDTRTTRVLRDVPMYVIHGAADEIFPVSAVQKFVEKQKAAGASIELHVVEGLSHYQTPRFISALKAAIPWIQAVWESKVRK
ncbi:MAG: lipase family protein [Candidatus Aminicenantales bacterium]